MNASVLNSPALRFTLEFSMPAFLLATAIVGYAWIVAPDLLPLQGRSLGDATYPITSLASSALIAYVVFTIFVGKVKRRFDSALLGGSIALLSFYVTCTHGAAALLIHKGSERWWLDALGAGFWSYMFWSFVGLWGLGVPMLGAVVGWRTHALLVAQHLSEPLEADAR